MPDRQFERSHMTFYLSSVVTMGLSVTVFKLLRIFTFDLENEGQGHCGLHILEGHT